MSETRARANRLARWCGSRARYGLTWPPAAGAGAGRAGAGGPAGVATRGGALGGGAAGGAARATGAGAGGGAARRAAAGVGTRGVAGPGMFTELDGGVGIAQRASGGVANAPRGTAAPGGAAGLGMGGVSGRSGFVSSNGIPASPASAAAPVGAGAGGGAVGAGVATGVGVPGWTCAVPAAAASLRSAAVGSGTGITPPQIAQRARTPPARTLAGTTRNIDEHCGQPTFMASCLQVDDRLCAAPAASLRRYACQPHIRSRAVTLRTSSSRSRARSLAAS